jgi:S1-C subfamily serine protease
MKLNKKIVYHVLVAISCVSLIGCGSVTRVKPLGNGYERVSYTQSSISEPEATQITLQYRKPNGRQIMIWPSAGGVVVRNDVAVFLGDVAAKQPNPENSRATDSRLFAVKAPELSLDITDQVFQKFSEETGVAFTNIVKNGIAVLKETGGAVEIGFVILGRGERGLGTINAHGATMTIPWNQIADIMREVKEKGVVRKDKVWGTSYIQKEFKPEVQK